MTETRVDLSEFNLLIATPMMNGQPDDTYNTSLDNTKQLIRQYGGKVENFKTKFIADVAYARSALFGAFLRNKDYTHCLMIDDDMGWTPEDVVWMLLLKREFLAAVGPKKNAILPFTPLRCLETMGKRKCFTMNWKLTSPLSHSLAELLS